MGQGRHGIDGDKQAVVKAVVKTMTAFCTCSTVTLRTEM